MHAPEQFQTRFSSLLLVWQWRSVSASRVHTKETAVAVLEVGVGSGKAKYTNEFWGACNAIKDSVNLQHRC